MRKDFERWNENKIQIDDSSGKALFHEREIWWCTIGLNIGTEQDGSTKRFERPIIILKKFNLDSCLAIPLTGRIKPGKYYFPLGTLLNREATAILSQVRFIDRKRLTNKIGVVGVTQFQELVHAFMKACLPYKRSLPAISGGEQA